MATNSRRVQYLNNFMKGSKNFVADVFRLLDKTGNPNFINNNNDDEVEPTLESLSANFV